VYLSPINHHTCHVPQVHVLSNVCEKGEKNEKRTKKKNSSRKVALYFQNKPNYMHR